MKSNSQPLNSLEKKASVSLAAVYAMRMLGLFMLLPVIALHAQNMSGATPTLIGLAVGIYGLTQALLQIPFGLLSDRFGRKPIIYIGLLLFALGSIWAGMAQSVTALICARALQGSGAVAAAIMALAADVSRESQRAKVMGIIGASIGASFLLSLALGPFLSSYVGVQGLFWLGLVFAVGSMLLVWCSVPTPREQCDERDVTMRDALRVLRDVRLMTLNASIFLLHALMTALFVFMPFILVDEFNVQKENHWHIYVPVLFCSLLLAAPLIVKASHQANPKFIITICVVGVIVSASGLFFFSDILWLMVVSLLLYFVFFSVLESLYPAQISKLAHADVRGTALGLYTSFQFLGAFVGASLMGIIGAKGYSATATGCGLLCIGVVWVGVIMWVSSLDNVVE